MLVQASAARKLGRRIVYPRHGRAELVRPPRQRPRLAQQRRDHLRRRRFWPAVLIVISHVVDCARATTPLTGPSIESRVAVVLRRPRLRSTRPDQEGRLQRASLPQPEGHGRAARLGEGGCGPVRSRARSAPDELRCRRAGRKPGQAPAVGRVGAAGPAAPSERARRPTAAAPLGSLVAYMVMHRRPYEPTFRVLPRDADRSSDLRAGYLPGSGAWWGCRGAVGPRGQWCGGPGLGGSGLEGELKGLPSPRRPRT